MSLERRDAFLDFLELERKEGLKAIDEWRKYIKHKTRTKSTQQLAFR